MSSSETYFVAATTVTRGPTSSAMRSYRGRIAAGSRDVRDHSLAARAAEVAAMGEEPLAVAGGAGVEPVDMRAAGGAERALDARPQIKPSADGDVGAERLPRRPGHLFSHLVAARSDRGADDSRELPRPECAHP